MPAFVDAANQKLVPMMWLTSSRTCHDWHGVGRDNSSGVTCARTDRVLAKARSMSAVLMSGTIRDRLRGCPFRAPSARRTRVDDTTQLVQPAGEVAHRRHPPGRAGGLEIGDRRRRRRTGVDDHVEAV